MRQFAIIGLAVLAFTVLLGGCTSNQQQMQSFANRCMSFGFQPGTSAFAGCMQKEVHAHNRSMDEFMYRQW